jgi:DNA anti-recombination protein RmuC
MWPLKNVLLIIILKYLFQMISQNDCDTLTRVLTTGQEEHNKPESSAAKLYCLHLQEQECKTPIAYIFRSKRAREQEQEQERARTRKQEQEREKEQEQESKSKREKKKARTRKQESKNEKTRERKRMAKPRPF